MRVLLLAVVPVSMLGLLSGCSSDSEPQESGSSQGVSSQPDADHSPRRDPEQAKAAIRELIPEAAGIPSEEHDRVMAQRFVHFDKYNTKPLSMVALASPVIAPLRALDKLREARKKEFAYVWRAPVPRRITWELKRSVDSGYLTMIQPDRIMELTCQVVGNSATGVVAFDVPDLYRGRVEYSAEYEKGAWRITQFRLPVHHWIFSRVSEDEWKWFDFFGDVDDNERFPPIESVSGKFLFEGRPASEGRIEFLHTEAPRPHRFPVSPRVECDQNGDFTARLPRGSYAVRLLTKELGAAHLYAARDGSPLVIEVSEGDNHVVLDTIAKEYLPEASAKASPPVAINDTRSSGSAETEPVRISPQPRVELPEKRRLKIPPEWEGLNSVPFDELKELPEPEFPDVDIDVDMVDTKTEPFTPSEERPKREFTLPPNWPGRGAQRRE